MPARCRWLVLALLLVPLACKSNGGDKDKDPAPDPGFWLVGDNGTMIRVDARGEASGYPLELDADLLAIACHGARTAWVAGEDGTVLHSRDAGERWDVIELDIAADWRALAVAEHTPEGAEALWLVGDAGAVAYTPDGGTSWITVPGANATFTGVATEPDGNTAIAVADDGSIWQLDEHAAIAIHSGGAALRSIDWATHADVAVAVGDDGTMLRAIAGDWMPVELSIDHDLHAVQIAADGSLTVAVGEAGAIVRIEADEIEVFEQHGASLHALHLGADGRGQAVGAAGVVLVSSDAGASWLDWTMNTAPTLRGVDDFHAGGHL
jgi:photosystem II stability/assembly factor-like uncharacterized protein